MDIGGHPGVRRGAECLKPLSPEARAYYQRRVAALLEEQDALEEHLHDPELRLVELDRIDVVAHTPHNEYAGAAEGVAAAIEPLRAPYDDDSGPDPS